MKYDIQFIIPICLIGKYKRRFNFFKKNGLFNIKEKKVLVTLLCETNNPNCLKGWPNGIDAELIHCPQNQEAAKVYYYFANYPQENLNNIRWIAKIDDDSLTDVSDLVDQLDEYGDSEKEFYFVAEILKNIEPEETKLCKKFGLTKWFERQIDGPYVAHEVEGSFLSRKAMQTIYSNSQAFELLKERANMHSGYTDIALACAARICKIYPMDTNFLTSESLIGDLNFLGGKLSHVHFVAPDINKNICNLFHSILFNKNSVNKSKYINKKFILQENQQNICKLQLMPNHKVAIISYVKNAPPPYDWTLWNATKNNLYFIGWDGNLVVKFSQENNKLKGKRRYENVEAILKPYE